MENISFEIDDETKKKLDKVIDNFKEDFYSKEDTYRAIFEMGLKTIELQGFEREEDLRWQLLMVSSQYAVIKFKYFQLQKQHRMLEMSLNGCEAENRFLKKLLSGEKEIKK